MATVEQLSTDIQVLRRDVEAVSLITTKFETAIDKLSDVANSLDKIIAVHDSRLETHEDTDAKLFVLIEERRKEAIMQYEVLHKRIGTMSDEFENDLRGSMRDMMDSIKDMKEKDDEHHKEMAERLTKLEMWKWYVVGCATVAGIIGSYVLEYMTL
tara:strand:- start:419 stop:886 length:468 start_codon:yes stop_codon:yes gene_type:complete